MFRDERKLHTGKSNDIVISQVSASGSFKKLPGSDRIPSWNGDWGLVVGDLQQGTVRRPAPGLGLTGMLYLDLYLVQPVYHFIAKGIPT